jgi:hypothetical protein
MGLLMFALGALMYLQKGWDPTSFFCTAGYVLCGVGMALPQCLSKENKDRLRGQENMAINSAGYQFFGTIFNVIGLAMGTLGSLMYSPTVLHAVFGAEMNDNMEWEWMRNWVNVIWAVSFFMFPIGVGMFLVERWECISAHNEAVGKPPPSPWDKNMRILVWAEIMLGICAVGGVFFCFDDDPGAYFIACALFVLAGVIKVSLLVYEVCEMSGCCCGAGVFDEEHGMPVNSLANEKTPLLNDDAGSTVKGTPGSAGKGSRGRDSAGSPPGSPPIAPSSDTSSLLGDPFESQGSPR